MFANRIAIETINLVGRAFVERFAPSGPVIDIGSFYTAEYAALCDRRPPERAYVGCDIRIGPGVDRIEDAEALSRRRDGGGRVASALPPKDAPAASSRATARAAAA